jgi:RNA polymerase sigma-70 factor (ECF subfamily)
MALCPLKAELTVTTLPSSPVSLSPDAVGVCQPEGLAQVFTQYGDFVWRTLQRLGVREADLEDVLQEVFIVVHRQLPTFGGRSKMSTWLYGICLRVASTHRRRAWVRREIPGVDLPDSPSSAADPEQNVDATMQRHKLAEVLDLMELEKRALLVMFELDELSCEEIAELLGIPIGTVHSRLYAAREAFQAALRESNRPPKRTKSWWRFERSR